jgi:hypothetical protein
MDPVEMVMRNAVVELEANVPLLERAAALSRQQSWYATEEALNNAVLDCRRALENLKRELAQAFRPGHDA